MKHILIITLLSGILLGCKKQDEWLNKKSNKSDIIPTTLADFQTILNNDRVMNASDGLVMVGSDNYVLQYATWQSLAEYLRDIYTWKGEISSLPAGTGWDSNYQRINNANVVLDGLATISKTTQNEREWNDLMGGLCSSGHTIISI